MLVNCQMSVTMKMGVDSGSTMRQKIRQFARPCAPHSPAPSEWRRSSCMKEQRVVPASPARQCTSTSPVMELDS